jgi:hypothetical protein
MVSARFGRSPRAQRLRDALAPVAAAQRRVDDWLAGRWRALLVAVAVLAQSLSAWRVLSRPGYPHLRDSRIFEYVGWQVARGRTLYVETFEVKPPLSFETTAALSVLAGDDQLLYHHLNVALTCAAAVCVVVLVGELAYDATGEPAAAVAAGLTPYVLPLFALRSGFGFKAKYFVVATGLLAVWFARRDRNALAGAAAAASVGYWQAALVFPVVVLAFAARRGLRAVGRVVAGGAVVSVLVLAPVLLAGVDGVVAMLNQVVLVSRYAAEGGGLLERAVRVPKLLWWGRGLLAVGAVGLVLAATRDRDRAWWVAVCGGWFFAVAVAVDLDAAPDLFPSVAVLGVAVALAAARAGPVARGAVLAMTVGIVVLNVGFLGGFGVVADPMTLSTDPSPVADPAAVDAPYSTAEHHALLWYGIPADTCHVFFGPTQQAWVAAVDGSPTEDHCRTTFP